MGEVEGRMLSFIYETFLEVYLLPLKVWVIGEEIIDDSSRNTERLISIEKSSSPERSSCPRFVLLRVRIS